MNAEEILATCEDQFDQEKFVQEIRRAEFIANAKEKYKN